MDINKIVCNPALVYLVISLIMLCVTVLLKLNTIDLSISFSQLSSIIIFTLILMGLCNIAPELSWVISTTFVVCTISIMLSLIMNWIAPPLL